MEENKSKYLFSVGAKARDEAGKNILQVAKFQLILVSTFLVINW